MTDSTQEETGTSEGGKKEVLVVASKVKSYIREKSGLNTSAAVMDILSDRMRKICDLAIESAKRDNRKTVLDRDFSDLMN